MGLGAHHLTIAGLERRFLAARDVVERSHCQVIWLLAKGHATAEVAALMALTPRWVSKLARRYKQDGETSLGDQRRGNAGGKPLLSADDLDALRDRLARPPDDGGLWTGPKVARWIALRLGRVHVHAPRGWEALKKLNWSIQSPRPRNPKAAGPREVEAFKKTSPTRSARKRKNTLTSRLKFGRQTSTGSA